MSRSLQDEFGSYPRKYPIQLHGKGRISADSSGIIALEAEGDKLANGKISSMGHFRASLYKANAAGFEILR
jgi:hypothetical protein